MVMLNNVPILTNEYKIYFFFCGEVLFPSLVKVTFEKYNLLIWISINVVILFTVL